MAKIFQYLAAFSICIGALCTGILIAWTSNIGPKLKDGDLNDLEFTDTDFSIFGAMMCLGAACTCIPVGFLLNILGRKLTLFLTVIPFTIGWALLYFASHMAITFVARFILGLAGGSFCIGAPLYNMEIADTKSRGMMGTFFQLFITIGIFFAQVMGYVLSVQAYLIVCAIIPFVFLICFALQPESPVFLVKKEKIDKAEKALKRLRNEDDNIADEMKQLQTNAAKENEMKGKCKETMSHKATKKATFICMMLMVFQQFTGINAIMFYTETIFSCANIEVNSALQTITVGLVQIVATLVSAVTIDKFGRKLLFLVSTSMMGVGVFLSLIFYIPFVYNISSESANEKLAWFPLIGKLIQSNVYSKFIT